MKPVMQTILAPPKGNCFAACVASILEIPLETVPHYMEHSDWIEHYQRWLGKQFGLGFLVVNLTDDGTLPPRGYTIVSGPSPRGHYQHSVVALNGEMVHDPHPAGAGIKSQETWDIFYLLDPASIRAATGEA